MGVPVVFFTRDLSSKGLQKIFERVSSVLEGKVAVKLHTGEPNGPNIIPVPWIKDLLSGNSMDANIVETNTYYQGERFTTMQHRKTLEINGWDFCEVDIMDSEGTTTLPVNGGKWFTEMSVGKTLTNYDSMLVLTHFKGHTKGGFGGSNKNIGIGCADGRIGKKMIHTAEGSDDQWSISDEEFIERMSESTKSVIDYFGKKICYINVMRNMSVSCDCEGIEAEPVVTPDVGILASLDILAIDSASIDLIYSMKESDNHDLVERIESRCGLRQLSYMRELGMGSDEYVLIDIDNGDQMLFPEEAVADVVPWSNK